MLSPVLKDSLELFMKASLGAVFPAGEYGNKALAKGKANIIPIIHTINLSFIQ
jgi:hypothetical protein